MLTLSDQKNDLRQLTLPQLQTALAEWGEPAFRARQVYEWLWKKGAREIADMTNLSKALRERLETHFAIRPVTVASHQRSQDGTLKSAFRLHDGHIVEGVLIPADDRMTACVSSQVGCSLSCKFCATGYLPRLRNLDAAEIYDQVVLIGQQAQAHYGVPLSNIVYMGMGEPLLNYRQVLRSAELITSPQGLGMAPRRLTVSTAGIAKMIRQLGQDGVKFNLALSLHAADDAKRSQIMPINEQNSLEALREALMDFYRQTRTRVTYEYIVFHNFNDTLDDAEALFRFTRHTPCKVNIIEYNPIAEADFVNTDEDRLEQFRRYLEARDVIVNVRRSRGKDIDAACGQLANKP